MIVADFYSRAEYFCAKPHPFLVLLSGKPKRKQDFNTMFEEQRIIGISGFTQTRF